MIDDEELEECFFEHLEKRLGFNVVERLQGEYDIEKTGNIRCLSQ